MNEEWEYELIKQFTSPGHAHVHSIRQMNLDHDGIGRLIKFIDSILTHHDQRLAEEIEGMKKTDKDYEYDKKLFQDNMYLAAYNSGFNAALSAVQERLKEGK